MVIARSVAAAIAAVTVTVAVIGYAQNSKRKSAAASMPMTARPHTIAAGTIADRASCGINGGELGKGHGVAIDAFVNPPAITAEANGAVR